MGINLKERFKKVYDVLLGKKLRELLWAQIFHDTVIDSKWLGKKNFSPGRWAVGYNFLYILYQSLEYARPKCILEIGLGQTTKMISQYVNHYTNTRHFIVEHDKEWIDFSKSSLGLSERSSIVNLELTTTSFKGTDNITIYKNFHENFNQCKFDMLCIDGPFGSKGYSRIDALSLVEKNLDDSFVILMDDYEYERQGEQNTIKFMRSLLPSSPESFMGVYNGAKGCVVLTSANLKFLCSL